MFRRWPFLLPFLSLSAGLVYSFSGFGYCHLPAVTAFFICLLLSAFLTDSRLFVLLVVVFFFSWGAFVLKERLSPDNRPDSLEKRALSSDLPVTLEGVISDRPSVSPENSRIPVKIESVVRENVLVPAYGSLMLYVREGDVSLARGDRIRFVSRISRPHRLGLPGEFDFRRYLSLQGISVIASVSSQNDIVLMRAGAVDSWLRTIDLAARSVGDSIRLAVPDARVSSVLTALLIGDQRRIPKDISDLYTRAGVSHILSISGFHIGILSAFISLVIVWLLTRAEYCALHLNVRKTAVFIAVPVMVAYLYFTGAAPATARSVIMMFIFAVSICFERERDSINTLLFAAFLLVVLYPPTLFDVSFQLSFISLWGILLAAPAIMKYTALVKAVWLRFLISFVAVSAAASFVTVLPVLYIFKVASLNGILTNFVIVPLLGYGAVLAGFVVLPLVAALPAAAPYLLWPAATLVSVSNTFISWCNSLPVLNFYGISTWDMSCFFLLLLIVTFTGSRSIITVSGVLLPLSALLLHLYFGFFTEGLLRISMLSVGQAEAILLRLPDGSTMLVDGGGYLYETGHDFGQRVMAPALGALHVSRLDRVVTTHGHPDHAGGLPYVLKNFPVGELWSGAAVSSELLDIVSSRRIVRKTLSAGDVITLPGGVSVTVISPVHSTPDANRDHNINEHSLVFRIKYGTFSMLFTADAGFEAEKFMLESGAVLNSTVLKVGHHGSRYSTSEPFLERVRPQIALISAGAGNRFGLPAQRTVDLLDAGHVSVYRTDRDGTIDVVTDGTSWKVFTPYKPE